MFKKPIRVKTSNRMKGSERKKLKQNISKQFPHLSDEQIGIILPNKEDLFVTKAENANNIYITCYCLNRNPMFYEVDKEGIFYPTVYALWQCTDLIPYMVTAPAVFEKICKGADLMLPGVITQCGGYENMKKGQLVAIKIVGNSAPVAVGTSTMSAEEMFECGMKGKGVIISHWYTDNLWSLGEKLDIPQIADKVFLEELEANKDADETGSALQELNLNANSQNLEALPDAEIGQSTTVICGDIVDTGEERSEEKSVDTIDPNDLRSGEERENLEDDIQLNPEEKMDQLLENCFHQAMLDGKKVELPILVTKFSAQYLHPACPEGQKIDVKKSKYKKMSKFLQEMQSRGLVQVAELSKGVLSITEMTLEHESLKNFKASSFAKDVSTAKAEAKIREEEERAKDSTGITVVEMFAVSGKTQAFFRLFDKSKGDAMDVTDIRAMLTGYVKDNGLASLSDKRKVVLDPILSDVLFDKDFNEGTVTWDTLFTRFIERMNPCHKTIINGKESKIKKGKVEPIEVKVQQRMGNKKVTLVHKLEPFGIDPNEFAHQLQLAAASSTTVSSCPDKNAAFQQVLIQGNQTHHVGKLLDDLKVPRRYITGLDKVKPKGKKR